MNDHLNYSMKCEMSGICFIVTDLYNKPLLSRPKALKQTSLLSPSQLIEELSCSYLPESICFVLSGQSF